MDLLPNPMQGADNTLYVSNANFFCPATCSEPDDVCTATKKPRKQDMFKTLANVAVGDFCPVVVQSHQLGPGIGGFRPDQLFSALNQVVRHKGHLLVCTACRCHGVITGAAHIPG
jgi:hypothetical protein